MVIENVQVVAVIRAKKTVHVNLFLGTHRRQPPIEHPPGIFGMALGITAAGTVEDDPTMAFLGLPRVNELQAKLRFANARRADHDC